MQRDTGRTSSEVDWRPMGERFQWFQDLWDVDAAKEILVAHPRPVYEVEIEPLRGLVGAPGEMLLLGVYVDWKKALTDEVDLAVPLIVAYGHEKRLPIDGWTRVGKAFLRDVKTLPIVELSREESRRIHVYSGRKPRRRRPATAA